MHYLYTQFHYANNHGLPIMRPMWMEFPTDTMTFGLGNQFMWGEMFLVAPKLGQPQKFSLAMNGVYNVTVYLPPEADWYVQQTKEFVAGSNQMQWIVVGDLEYPVFIKAGSIIPFLQVKESAMSLMQTIDANLRIEVFPDFTGIAKGALYLDDYQTH